MIEFYCSGLRPLGPRTIRKSILLLALQIKEMSHLARSRKELDNCPVVNWEVYRKKRLERDGGASGYLGERPQADMYPLFRCLG